VVVNFTRPSITGTKSITLSTTGFGINIFFLINFYDTTHNIVQ
jgi:hypothetical protein